MNSLCLSHGIHICFAHMLKIVLSRWMLFKHRAIHYWLMHLCTNQNDESHLSLFSSSKIIPTTISFPTLYDYRSLVRVKLMNKLLKSIMMQSCLFCIEKYFNCMRMIVLSKKATNIFCVIFFFDHKIPLGRVKDEKKAFFFV